MIFALAGCGGYRPGSFSYSGQSFAGERATIGCLDVSVATRTRSAKAAVIVYDFGNHCDHPTTVDLAAVSVVGRTTDGRDVPMFAHDPNHELRALPIDGRLAGHEAIAYEAEKSPVEQICVDAAAIAHEPPRWMCFAGSAPVISEVTP
jgi:hypothetical protein